MAEELNAKIERLLHECHIASVAAEIALGECDVIRNKQLLAKARGLRDVAGGLDPEHRAAGWKTER